MLREQRHWGLTRPGLGRMLVVGNAIVFLLASVAHGATVNVAPSPGCNDGTGMPAYCSIQTAINAAAAADTVALAAGTYTELITIGKSLTLQGVGAATSTISGGSMGRVVTISNTATDVTISALTITAGNAPGDAGGISSEATGTLRVEDCVVSAHVGSGIFVLSGNSIIERSLITGCNGSVGGGIATTGISTTITDCTISNNSAANLGGGLFSVSMTLDIDGSAFTGNSAATAAGAMLIYPMTTATITNTTMSGNSAAVGAGIVHESLCFTGETVVATSDGLQPIATIAQGQQVWAIDIQTGETSLQSVTRTFEHLAPAVLRITVGNEVIRATGEHPFWVEGKGWIPAAQLQAGDTLRTQAAALLPIIAIENEVGAVPVYNIEVDGAHTYFVSEENILVHNK